MPSGIGDTHMRLNFAAMEGIAKARTGSGDCRRDVDNAIGASLVRGRTGSSARPDADTPIAPYPRRLRRTEVAQMPNDKGTAPHPPQNSEGGLFKNLILLALPLLCFQRDILPTIRASFEAHKDEHIKAIGKFLSSELHAVMMILDPARKLRGRVDDNLETQLKDELTKILEKLHDGLVTVVQIQEQILPQLIETLKGMKNGKDTNTRNK
jgi:hypothetical protein